MTNINAQTTSRPLDELLLLMDALLLICNVKKALEQIQFVGK